MAGTDLTTELVRHTESPWLAEAIPIEAYADPDLDVSEDDVFWIVGSGPEHHVIATVHRYPIEQAEANARLFAKAPAMLEMLKEVADVLDTYSDVDKGYANRARQTLQDVNALLAKIEGGQS